MCYIYIYIYVPYLYFENNLALKYYYLNGYKEIRNLEALMCLYREDGIIEVVINLFLGEKFALDL